MAAYGDGRYGLSIAAHQRYLNAYFDQCLDQKTDASGTLLDRQYAFQLKPAADLSGLPPTLLVAAEIDILRDQTLEMASSLRAAGNEMEAMEVKGVTHGFLAYGAVLTEVNEVIGRAAQFVHRQA